MHWLPIVIMLRIISVIMCTNFFLLSHSQNYTIISKIEVLLITLNYRKILQNYVVVITQNYKLILQN